MLDGGAWYPGNGGGGYRVVGYWVHHVPGYGLNTRAMALIHGNLANTRELALKHGNLAKYTGIGLKTR